MCVTTDLVIDHGPTPSLTRGRCVGRKKLKSEILHYVQNDKEKSFCHSAEQSDEESRGCAKISSDEGGK